MLDPCSCQVCISKLCKPGSSASVVRAHTAQVRRPMLLLGASLGSAAAVDFALAHPEAVAALVLVSPQCYTDGIGPMATLPRPLARLGVAVRRKGRNMRVPDGALWRVCILASPCSNGNTDRRHAVMSRHLLEVVRECCMCK